MSEISTAAAALATVVRGIRPEQLTGPTPCTEFDVRALLGHLAHWAPSLAGAGRKQTVEPSEVDDDDPRNVLLDRVSDIVAAWDTPGSHEGSTHMGGPTEMPAALVADMVLGELVVHGWDLARATGQPFELPEDLLKRLHDGVLAHAAQAREMGVYGPEVPVPASASTLDRILGLTGRNPDWGS
ncbi:TIGR03086 family metal-binding protein [Amycolatopsis sacchari]|uniref:TIGR03086 family protein n=1 Tax=Amycolatopsis sacchari TaxID=115433 RepID=A0A1I3T2J2_9PSEU|nr:TIGR03086 family metal-binding protein [Amycolatopsis sacchari]SFJ64399.1 TIGR03086 family protein [Amycolatopsis sacchari]